MGKRIGRKRNTLFLKVTIPPLPTPGRVEFLKLDLDEKGLCFAS